MGGTAVDYVESGSYSVGGQEKRILKALLGSCVGVAMYDPVGRVGGLIHLILPLPEGTATPWNPAAYASTGIPLFIDALCRAGAEKKRLVAFVAGGALIGEVLDRDLMYDIGGRTTEVVAALLKKNSIPVQMSETGGVYNMTLGLDLETGGCAITPVLWKADQSERALRKPTTDEITGAIARIRPIPQVALKVIRMIGDSSYNMLDIAEEIGRDQIIAARVLNLANSAMVGRKEQIDSVDEALMVLGEKKMLSLVVSASAELFFSHGERGYSQCRGTLYHRAVGVALVAEQLALHTSRCDPAVAYTAGLLHDIGKVVLDHFVAQNIPLFYRRTYGDNLALEEAEEEILGIGHPEAGSMLAGLWSIPANLTEAIRYHHQPDRATLNPDLVCIVSLANMIITKFSVTPSLECRDTSTLSFVLDRLGIRSDDLHRLLGRVSWDQLNNMKPRMTDQEGMEVGYG